MTSLSAGDRIPILVPDLDSDSEPLRVCAWLVDPGQTVIVGDRVVSVLIPGIAFDIAATHSGELVEIVRPVDATVAVGEILGWIALEPHD